MIKTDDRVVLKKDFPQSDEVGVVQAVYNDINTVIVKFGDTRYKFRIDDIELYKAPEPDPADGIIISDQDFALAQLKVCTADYLMSKHLNSDFTLTDWEIVAKAGIITTSELWSYLKEMKRGE